VPDAPGAIGDQAPPPTDPHPPDNQAATLPGEDEQPDGEAAGDFEAEDGLSPGEDWMSPVGESMTATFDALALTSLLRVSGPATDVDLHVFAYLACLMSMYHGQPAAAWGYQFSAVPPTLPYSTAIAQATDLALDAGLLSTEENLRARFLAPTAKGERLFGSMRVLTVFRDRPKYLEASTATALLHTLPGVVNSVVSEPELTQSINIDVPRLLLGRRMSQALYSQFQDLSKALGDVESDLLVPASVYVRFLEQRLGSALSTDLTGGAANER
jgi:hypothetical protein